MKTGTIARLFGNAGNRCSWCRDELEIANVRIGEMAHIIAQSPRGPRGEIGNEGDIDDYDNLILLCDNHHTTIDGDASQFPIEYVRQMKASHEAWVRSCLADVSQRYLDVHGLQALLRFLPLTQINGAFHMLPGSMHPALLQTLSALEAFPLDNPQCRPFIDPHLERCYVEFGSRFGALMAALAGPDFGQAYYEPTERGGSLILSRHLAPSTAADVKRDVQAAIEAVCWRRSNIDPPRRSKFDPGRDAAFLSSSCG